MPQDEVNRVRDLLMAFAEAAEDDSHLPDPAVFQLAAESERTDHRVLAKLIGDALSDRG